jgi:L-ascorbate metabolism protein UlaG (beta-lactamase superfamily)
MSPGMKISYIGHATVIVEFENCRFITDPLLTNRIALIGPKRKVAFKLDKEALAKIKFAAASRGHFDHH